MCPTLTLTLTSTLTLTLTLTLTQHEPSDDDVSEYLDHALSPEKIRQIVQTVQARTSSLDAPRGGSSSSDSRNMVDTIEARLTLTLTLTRTLTLTLTRTSTLTLTWPWPQPCPTPDPSPPPYQARPGQPSLQDSVVVTMLRADLRKTMEVGDTLKP